MKKKLLVLLLLTIIITVNAVSQTTPQKPVKTGNEWKMPADVFKRSETYSTNLKVKLGLSDSQTKKVYDAFLANTKPVDEIQISPGSEEEKKIKLKTNKAEFNETLKGILSPAQFDKYLKIKPAI